MIWDYIRDFIVEYITGGCNSAGVYYSNNLGTFMNVDGNTEEACASTDYYVFVGNGCIDGHGIVSYDNKLFVSFSDWLATTITAVIMVLMVVLACLLVRWVFKLVVNGFLARR